MTLNIKFRPKAESDLEGIWDYTLTRWGSGQAISYLENLRSGVDLLADYPEMARLREEFDPPVRLHPVRKHLVVYVTNGEDLEIIRVLHNRTDWAAYLAE